MFVCRLAIEIGFDFSIRNARVKLHTSCLSVCVWGEGSRGLAAASLVFPA